MLRPGETSESTNLTAVTPSFVAESVPPADHGRGMALPNMASTWWMLLALGTAFSLSQAYRTTAAMMATRLQADFNLSAQQLGGFAGAFHFAFGAMQLFMGVSIDLHGVRRTVLVAFPFAVIGALVSAFSTQYAMVVAGQVLVGIGCAPAFLVCTVFISRRFAPERFAAVSGVMMGVGGLGMLITATPLAWIVAVSSWRTGFMVLAALSVLAWLVIYSVVREDEPAHERVSQSLGMALRSVGALFAMPHTLGIVALGAVTYAAFMTLRGLWLGPLLTERFGYSLVQSGNIALLVSMVSIVGPPFFGRLTASGAVRRRWIIGFTLVYASLFAVLAVASTAMFAVPALVLTGFLSGFIVLQYADVRAAYPAALTGRAMAVYTMAMFLGIGVMQWATGAIASLATHRGVNGFSAVLFAIALLLGAGALAFVLLPAPVAKPLKGPGENETD